MTVNHIGIIVGNIEKSIEVYSRMGYDLKDKIVFDYNQNNKIALMCSEF